MPREHYSDLLAFIAVAQARSFTRAAATLGMSQSMLSHTVRALEARIGVRLLTRTTRSVSVTEAGERLLQVAAPRFDNIEAELRSVAELSDVVAGTIRITATDHAIDTLLWPRLSALMAEHPKLNIEFSADYALTDIVKGRYDFGVRLGDELSKDTSAVRIGPDMRLVIVGSPAYFAQRAMPATPQDLMQHDCINLRLATRGNFYAWELQKGQTMLNVKVEGRLVFNGIYQILAAALAGGGLAYVPQEMAAPHFASGQLVPVLKPWWRKFPGLHLYYSSERQTTRAMQAVIEALRYRKSAVRRDLQTP